MITKLPIDDSRLPIEVGLVSPCRDGGRVGGTPDVVRYRGRSGFSMVELLVAMTLLSLIVFALMAVFSSTQQAFRSSVTQTDILEGSRMAMQMMSDDLHGLVPSDQVSNYVNLGVNGYYYGAVNFSTATNMYLYTPLVQPLLGGTGQRTNYLQYFFVLGKVNLKWTAVGYAVNSMSASPLYPLYRYYAEAPITGSPISLYWNFTNMIYYSQWTNMSHVMDGVVHLVVRAYDMSGYEMTNTVHYYNGNQAIAYQNVNFLPPYTTLPSPMGEANFVFFSNAVPAAVELQLGVLEDRTLQRAESLGNGLAPYATMTSPQWLYLKNQAGHVHLFRQRVTIPNVDPTAYQ